MPETLLCAAGRSSSCERQSRDALVLRYAYLGRRGARKFLRAGLERLDLEQVATLGLIKAADRFDESRGTPFEAFAWVAILGELLHYVRDHEHLVRLPRRLASALPALRRSIDDLAQRLEREPTDLELARDLGAAVDEVRELRRAMTANGRARAADDDDLERVAASYDVVLAERLDLVNALEKLPARERRIVVGVYVLGLSNVEIGDRLALSARHVARLRRSALDRMQHVCAMGVPA